MTEGPTGFVHLHVHTHYSLLDGANRIPDLVAAAKKMGMKAIAITDHGNMFGVIEFYQTALKAGIKPIIGMEAYLAPGDRRSRDARGMSEASFHLLLLAENLIGYHNLLKLSSIAYREGFYYRPRIDREVLAAHSEGLICTSTCLAAEIPQALLKRDRTAAESAADWYLTTFGPERFFVELQDHGIAEQRQINPELIEIAKRRGVGLIASNDVHYLTRDDREAHDILLCISTGKLVSDEDRMKFDGDQFYLKSPDEMRALFIELPEALDNTVRIANRCNVDLDFSKRHTPVYRTPKGKTPEQYLRELVYEGARRKYGNVSDEATKRRSDEGGEQRESGKAGKRQGRHGGEEALSTDARSPQSSVLSPDVVERIDYELDVIASKGFSGYFLIVADFVHYAKSRGIPCSARGSGCSAVVAYCLDISLPDPLRYGLYFERFMDPDRDEMPDIDIDICQEGREEVIRYVREKYGHVAQIITFGTLKPRAAIRDVCRVLGVPLAQANDLAKLVPEALKMTVEKALQQEPELRKLYEHDDTVHKVIDISRRIEGFARHAGVHAAGVVIAEKPLDNYIPIYRQSESRSRASRTARSNGAEAWSESDAASGAVLGGTDITQFDGVTVEKVGLLKMDFLGLRTLTILERARQLAGNVAAPHPVDKDGLLDLERLDLADLRVYDLFARGETEGIFQFESGGMRDVVMKMRPNRIEDLIAGNALYRPGPMVNIDAYITRKHGEKWKTPHAIMDEVLAETYGIIVYQEQVARLVNRLGGIERKRAFRLAKAISKKKTDMIEAEREPFISGAMKNGVKRETAEEIFNQILPFGEYAFNKAHSTGYALVAFQTAYMKAHFPLEYMAALLTFESQAQKIDQWYTYIDECKRMGIDIRPPDVNSSDADFTIVRSDEATKRRSDEGAEHTGQRPVPRDSGPRTQDSGLDSPSGCIRFGLAAIKGAGDKAVASIIEARRDGGSFRDLFDFCERVDLQVVNRGVIESLIKSGAFDTTGAMRKGLMLVVDSAMQAGQLSQSDRRAGQLNMFGAFQTESAGPPRTIPNAEWTESEMLAFEKATLGFYVTAHPLTRHAATLEKFASADCVDLSAIDDGTPVVLGGMISRVRYVITKSGRNAGSKLAVAMFEDLTGSTEAVIFSEELEKFRQLVAPEKLVFLRGRVDRRREEPSLRVTDVIPLEEAAAKLAAAVLIRLNTIGLHPEDLSKLRDICRAHHGERPLFLEIVAPQGLIATMRCNGGLTVCPDALFMRNVAALIGEANIRIVGPPRHVVKPVTPAPVAEEHEPVDEPEESGDLAGAAAL